MHSASGLPLTTHSPGETVTLPARQANEPYARPFAPYPLERKRSRTVRVPMLGDTSPEGPETFTLTLTNPAGGGVVLGRATGRATILDDDK